MSDNTVRAVLLKPGDVLLIGNAGTLSDKDVRAIGQAAAELRSALGLAHVLVFHEDIDLAVTTPSSTEAEENNSSSSADHPPPARRVERMSSAATPEELCALTGNLPELAKKIERLAADIEMAREGFSACVYRMHLGSGLDSAPEET